MLLDDIFNACEILLRCNKVQERTLMILTSCNVTYLFHVSSFHFNCLYKSTENGGSSSYFTILVFLLSRDYESNCFVRCWKEASSYRNKTDVLIILHRLLRKKFKNFCVGKKGSHEGTVLRTVSDVSD